MGDQSQLVRLGLVLAKYYPEEAERLLLLNVMQIADFVNERHDVTIYRGMNLNTKLPQIIAQIEKDFIAKAFNKARVDV